MLLVKVEGRAFCMRFSYHMYGSGMGTLTVMRKVQAEKDDHTPKVKEFKQLHEEWKKSGNLGNQWHEAEVDLQVVRSVRKGTIHWVGSLLRCHILKHNIQFAI